MGYLFCQVASCEGKLIVMGGWDPASWEPLRDVFVYEFTTRKWTQRVDMPSTRSFFASSAYNGNVYVAGGHDENKNALRSVWERDECEGVVVGSEFWVVSGYDTDTQGRFKNSADVLDMKTGIWRRVEGTWGSSRCPRSCLAVGQNGNFTSWDGYEPAVQVGTCGVDLGDRVVVTGSGYQGGAQVVFVVEKTDQGQNGKFTKVDIPYEFSGFVQSVASLRFNVVFIFAVGFSYIRLKYCHVSERDWEFRMPYGTYEPYYVHIVKLYGVKGLLDYYLSRKCIKKRLLF
ncbi:putative kelch-type beta propeller [Helianthus annuus]|nr:putative kelch-type beta propeller [Helianthus annuus]